MSTSSTCAASVSAWPLCAVEYRHLRCADLLGELLHLYSDLKNSDTLF